MENVSNIILNHYQRQSVLSGQGWAALLSEPIAHYLADNCLCLDSDLKRSLRDVAHSSDPVKDMAHNCQYLKRHLENNQLRADLVPFLIKFSPQPDELMHDFCAALGVLPVMTKNLVTDEPLTLANSFLAMGEFNEQSGGLTSTFSKMLASNGGLGPEDREYVPQLLRSVDRVISWANNIKKQVERVFD